MNVLMLLKPKKTVKYIYDHSTLRQGLEIMKKYGYTALPVINSDGRYIGTVSEGDFLYYILERRDSGMKSQEKHNIHEIVRGGFNPAVKIDVSMDELLERAQSQNFIPVVDSLDNFIGIVTRQDIIKYFINKS